MGERLIDSGQDLLLVILGILIALPISRCVEDRKDASAASAAEGAMNSEIVANGRYLAERALRSQCVERRLEELATILDSADEGAGGPTRPIGRPPLRPLNEGAWQASAAAEAITHFTIERQQLYASIYQTFRRFMDEETREQASWARLSTIQRGVSRLTALELATLRIALAEASASYQMLTLLAKDYDQQSKALLVTPSNVFTVARGKLDRFALCRPLTGPQQGR